MITVPITPRLGSALSDSITHLERFLGLSDRDLAATLGVTTRTVTRWREGETLPQRIARDHLTALLNLCDRLAVTFEAEDIPGWLRGENRALGGLRPIDALRAGRIDRVDDALEVIDSGIFV